MLSSSKHSESFKRAPQSVLPSRLTPEEHHLFFRASSIKFWIGVKSIHSGRLIMMYSLSFLRLASGGTSSGGRSSLSELTLSSSVLACKKAVCPSGDKNQLMKTRAALGCGCWFSSTKAPEPEPI